MHVQTPVVSLSPAGHVQPSIPPGQGPFPRGVRGGAWSPSARSLSSAWSPWCGGA